MFCETLRLSGILSAVLKWVCVKRPKLQWGSLVSFMHVIQSFYSANKVFMFPVLLSPPPPLAGCQLVFYRPLLTPLKKARNNVDLSAQHGGKEIKMSQGAFKAVFRPRPPVSVSFLHKYPSAGVIAEWWSNNIHLPSLTPQSWLQLVKGQFV